MSLRPIPSIWPSCQVIFLPAATRLSRGFSNLYLLVGLLSRAIFMFHSYTGRWPPPGYFLQEGLSSQNCSLNWRKNLLESPYVLAGQQHSTAPAVILGIFPNISNRVNLPKLRIKNTSDSWWRWKRINGRHGWLAWWKTSRQAMPEIRTTRRRPGLYRCVP